MEEGAGCFHVGDARERELLAATGAEAGGMGQRLEAGKGQKTSFFPLPLEPPGKNADLLYALRFIR